MFRKLFFSAHVYRTRYSLDITSWMPCFQIVFVTGSDPADEEAMFPCLLFLHNTEWFAMLKIIVRMGVTLLWIYCPRMKMRPIFLFALIAHQTPTSTSCRLGRCRVWRKLWVQEHRSLQDTIPAVTVSSKPITYLTEKIHIHSHNRHRTKLA